MKESSCKNCNFITTSLVEAVLYGQIFFVNSLVGYVKK